jgi:hypothetical protein
VAISHSIREQIAFFKRTLLERGKMAELKSYHRPIPVQHAVRDEDELPFFTPALNWNTALTSAGVTISVADIAQRYSEYCSI